MQQTKKQQMITKKIKDIYLKLPFTMDNNKKIKKSIKQQIVKRQLKM